MSTDLAVAGLAPGMVRTLLTGATGTLGTALRPRLVEAGHHVRAASRSPPEDDADGVEWTELDLVGGTGIERAVAGADVVVHTATAPQGDTEAVDEVADALVDHAVPEPAGRVADAGGPEVLTVGEIAASYRDIRGLRRPIVRLPLPGAVASGFRNGDAVCPDRAVGAVTWEEWLERQYGSATNTATEPTTS